jgi:hypothetical protein
MLRPAGELPAPLVARRLPEPRDSSVLPRFRVCNAASRAMAAAAALVCDMFLSCVSPRVFAAMLAAVAALGCVGKRGGDIPCGTFGDELGAMLATPTDLTLALLLRASLTELGRAVSLRVLFIACIGFGLSCLALAARRGRRAKGGCGWRGPVGSAFIVCEVLTLHTDEHTSRARARRLSAAGFLW